MSMILSLLLPKAEPRTGDCHATPYSDHVLEIILNNTNDFVIVANFSSVYNQKHPKSPRDYNFRVAVAVPIFREVNFSPECKSTNILSDSDSHLDSDS